MRRADAAFWARSSDTEQTYKQIAALAAQHGAHKLVLYGSRARGDNRPKSDIDLAVYGMPDKQRTGFRFAVEELPTLLEVDIAFIGANTEKHFLANIEKDGVILMGSYSEKYSRLQDAVERLSESLTDYNDHPCSTMRDGVIQRFEFCTELAWKTIREYLLDQEYSDVNSPKAVLRKAYQEDLLKDEGWLEMVDDRNLTSHVYDDDTAALIFGRIRNNYLPLMQQLLSTLQE